MSSDDGNVVQFRHPPRTRKITTTDGIEITFEESQPTGPASDKELVEILLQMAPGEREYASIIIASFLRGNDELQDLVRRAIQRIDDAR